MRGATCERTCSHCLGKFTARVADVNRGWARYCSKRCKAIAQEARTGQYRQLVAEKCGGPTAGELEFEGLVDQDTRYL